MNKMENTREKKIFEIVSIVKLASLLLCGIIIFKHYYFADIYISTISKNRFLNLISIELSTFVLTLIYVIWTISSRKKFESKYNTFIVFIENCIFIIIFFILIFFSGAETSQYKFLFLFIIITSTIQMGMKHGVTIACISSLMILGMDLVCVGTNGVNHYFENDLILAGVFILTAWPLGYYVETENQYRKKLAELVNIDGLTSVYNHRFFHEALKREVELYEKHKKPISLLLLDIDYFKHYNDLYGHQKGDEVLRKIGEILKTKTPSQGIAARYGGEEFAVILPNTSEKEALLIAEEMRLEVEHRKFYGEENQPKGKVTTSIGISTFPDKAKTDLELIKSADDALYRAKFFNKNRVETYYSVLEELKKDLAEEDINLITSIKTLISVINAKDKYTYAHSERVVMFSKLLGDKLLLSREEKKILKYGAYMHDIGKINIPKEILNKKMPLTNEEWELLKQHPVNGIDIIKSVDSLKNILPLILHHHERYDGNGYPSKLKGEDIPFLTRIITVVDSFDAMTSNRPYNIGKSYDEAIEELRRCSSTQFDPDIVEAFIEVVMEHKDTFDNCALTSL